MCVNVAIAIAIPQLKLGVEENELNMCIFILVGWYWGWNAST